MIIELIMNEDLDGDDVMREFTKSLDSEEAIKYAITESAMVNYSAHGDNGKANIFEVIITFVLSHQMLGFISGTDRNPEMLGIEQAQADLERVGVLEKREDGDYDFAPGYGKAKLPMTFCLDALMNIMASKAIDPEQSERIDQLNATFEKEIEKLVNAEKEDN